VATAATPSAAGQSAPEVKFTVVQGPTGKAVPIIFVKQSHLGAYIESQRGTGPWKFGAIDTKSVL
jgi:hypothetical protein